MLYIFTINLRYLYISIEGQEENPFEIPMIYLIGFYEIKISKILLYLEKLNNLDNSTGTQFFIIHYSGSGLNF